MFVVNIALTGLFSLVIGRCLTLGSTWQVKAFWTFILGLLFGVPTALVLAILNGDTLAHLFGY